MPTPTTAAAARPVPSAFVSILHCVAFYDGLDVPLAWDRRAQAERSSMLGAIPVNVDKLVKVPRSAMNWLVSRRLLAAAVVLATPKREAHTAYRVTDAGRAVLASHGRGDVRQPAPSHAPSPA